MASEDQTVVFVGSSYGGKTPSNWAMWDEPLDSVVGKMATRAADVAPSGSAFHVYEVTVRRVRRVGSRVQVEELDQ